MKTFLKELDSTYNNLSFLNYKRNFHEIISCFTSSSKKRLQHQLDELLSNMDSITGAIKEVLEVKGTVKHLIYYNRHYTGYDRFIIKDFVNCVSCGVLGKVIKFNNKKVEDSYILTYNFNTEKLLEYSLQTPETVKERVLEYAGAFYHFSLFLLMFSILSNELSSDKLVSFMFAVAEKVNLALLGGFEAYTEMGLPLSYSAFYEELSSIRTFNEKKLSITLNEEKETIAFTVRDNSIFQDRYKKEQKTSISSIYAEKLDTKSLNLFRISRGNKENSIKFIFKKASGQRTLGRIFGFNEKGKIHPNTLYDSGLSCLKQMLFFCFMAIMDKCHRDEVRPSKYMALDKFIKSYKGERYVTESITVISLMSLHPELKEDIIKEYLIHKEQRNNILKEVRKLEKLLKECDLSLLKCLLKQIRREYVW